jgi:hypothetical protein
MSQAGLLLQVDGSRHRWLEDRGPQLTLHGGIDDATGTVTGGLFREQEDAAGYFAVFAQTTATYGLPVATYSDRHGIFVREPARPATISEQLTGRRTFTQVGRALDAVGIAWIGARSPQAKGRIERLWGTLQDRLVVELRLAGASTLGEANGILATYLARHNARFAVAPADPVPAWRALPEDLTAEAIFCFHYPRRVARDATVSWGREALALPRRSDGRSWAGRSVVLQERLDGSLWVRDGTEHHRLSEAPPVAPLLRARPISRAAAVEPPSDRPLSDEPRPPSVASTARTPYKPAADHPWRRYAATRPK